MAGTRQRPDEVAAAPNTLELSAGAFINLIVGFDVVTNHPVRYESNLTSQLNRGLTIILYRALNGGAMKAYVITSGGIFGVLTIAHLLRIAVENRHLATEPVYILITLASATLCVWAWVVLRRSKR